MDQKIVRGIGWTVLSFGGSRVLNLVTTAVLARLLVPADFGVVALAMIVVVLVNFIRDMGLSGTLIADQELERRELGTLFVLMLAMSVIAAVLVVAAAPFVAAFFAEPRLGGVLRGLSVMVALGGVTWFYDGVLQREMHFRGRFLAQFVQNALYGVVAVALAVAGFGVSSIVIGQVVGAVAGALMALILSPYHVRPSCDAAAARRMLSTSRGYLLQWVLVFVEQNAAVFAIGRMLDPVRVSYYFMSYRIAELPYMTVADPVARVTLPAYSQMRHRGEEVASAYLAVLRLVAVLTVPAGLLLSACAGPVILVMLGANWLPMTAVLAVLGLWVPVQSVQATVRALLNAAGKANRLGVLSAFLLLPLVPGLLLAARHGGVVVVALVVLLETAVALAAMIVVAHRRAGVRVRLQWHAVRPVVLAAPGCWAAAFLTVRFAEQLGAGALPLAVLAGAGCYLAVLSLAEPGLVATTVEQLRRMGRRGARST